MPDPGHADGTGGSYRPPLSVPSPLVVPDDVTGTRSGTGPSTNRDRSGTDDVTSADTAPEGLRDRFRDTLRLSPTQEAALRALAEHGSLDAAARALGITRNAVDARLKKVRERSGLTTFQADDRPAPRGGMGTTSRPCQRPAQVPHVWKLRGLDRRSGLVYRLGQQEAR